MRCWTLNPKDPAAGAQPASAPASFIRTARFITEGETLRNEQQEGQGDKIQKPRQPHAETKLSRLQKPGIAKHLKSLSSVYGPRRLPSS